MNLYLLAMLMSLSAFDAHSNENSTIPLKLVVGSDCKEFGLTEDINLVALIKNMQDDSQIIYTNDMWRTGPYGFQLKLIKTKNNQLINVNSSHSIPLESDVRNEKNYSYLWNGSVVGARQEFSVYEIFKESGDYLLFAEYTSPIPKSLSPIKNIWSREMPVISSNKIRIKIHQVGTFCNKGPE